MLTQELLNGNATLTSLSDEQKQAIVTLSQNDESAVIAAKTSKIYGDLDADILNVSGVAKGGTEKTYDYAKRVITELKGKAESVSSLETQVRSLTQKNAQLEKSIAEGNGNEQLNKELKQAKADLASVTNQFVELQKQNAELTSKYEKDLFNYQVESELKAASVGVKFKPDLPESATKVLMQQAIDKVKGMNPELIDDGKGGRVMVFKDAQGAILRNQATNLNPFTATELLNRELDGMGILDKGRQGAGGGTTPMPGGNGSGNPSLSIDGVRTRTEAFDVITNILTQQGLKVGTSEFNAAMNQAWKDNNISRLPEK